MSRTVHENVEEMLKVMDQLRDCELTVNVNQRKMLDKSLSNEERAKAAYRWDEARIKFDDLKQRLKDLYLELPD